MYSTTTTTTTKTTTALLLALATTLLVPTTTAHGIVSEIRTGGQSYPGWLPWWKDSPWPHAKSAGWPQGNQDYGFVLPETYSTFDIACGKDATPGEAIIPVNAGDKVDLLWTEWPQSHHGPVVTYMAKCPGDCTKMDKTKLDFFKIDGLGMLSVGEAPG